MDKVCHVDGHEEGTNRTKHDVEAAAKGRGKAANGKAATSRRSPKWETTASGALALQFGSFRYDTATERRGYRGETTRRAAARHYHRGDRLRKK